MLYLWPQRVRDAGSQADVIQHERGDEAGITEEDTTDTDNARHYRENRTVC